MILSLLAAAYAQTVSAGASPELNAQLFRPTADAHGMLLTDLARRGVHNAVTGRLLGHYTHEPLVYQVEDGEKVALVGSVTQADLVGGYAYDRLRVGAVLPIYLMSTGDAAGNETGLGDVALDAKVTLLDPGDVPVGLGVQGRMELPTATVTAPLGDPNVGWELAAVADADLGDRVLLAANLGLQGGPSQSLENLTVNDYFVARVGPHVLLDPDNDIGTSLELSARSALPGDGAGAGTALEWLLGGHGRIPNSDAVLRAGAGTGLSSGLGTPDFRVVVGIGWEPPMVRDRDGDGIVDKDDTCPTEPEDLDGFEDVDGCPDPDNDGDTIVDTADQCIDVPEDLDGFSDDDGCPDPDNDEDGLADTADSCPDDPEDADGYADDDGCPEPEVTAVVKVQTVDGTELTVAKGSIDSADKSTTFVGAFDGGLAPGSYTILVNAPGYKTADATVTVGQTPFEHVVVMEPVPTKVVVTRDRIDLKDKIYFDTGKASIQKRSHGLLDDAVQILRDYPEIQKLRIEGHTDSRGSDTFNKKLSQDRADSVMNYFIEAGIDASRLTAVGYGEENPLDPAKTQEAYSKNRRVDFFVEVWEDQPTE
jgi:outer membrane protein OmpA-like peptidoglycan-associated protein